MEEHAPSGRFGVAAPASSHRIFASAPELEDVNWVVGTRLQVLAALTIQAAARRRRAKGGPPPSEAMIVNIDTGLAISLDEVNEMYNTANMSTASAFEGDWQQRHSCISDATCSVIPSPRTPQPPISSPEAIGAPPPAAVSSTFLGRLFAGSRLGVGTAAATAAAAPPTPAAARVARWTSNFAPPALSSPRNSSPARNSTAASVATPQDTATPQHPPPMSSRDAAAQHGRSARRGAMHGRTLEPLMSGPLLKRGKHLHNWKLRWYTLGVDGEFTCYRQVGHAALKCSLRANASAGAPMPVRARQCQCGRANASADLRIAVPLCCPLSWSLCYPGPCLLRAPVCRTLTSNLLS